MNKQEKLNQELTCIILETERDMIFNKLKDRATKQYGKILPTAGRKDWNSSLTKTMGQWVLWFNYGKDFTGIVRSR